MTRLFFFLCIFSYTIHHSLAQSLREDTLEARKLLQKAYKSANAKDYKQAIRKLDEALDIYYEYEMWDLYFSAKTDIAQYEYKNGAKTQAFETLEEVVGESLERYTDTNPAQAVALTLKASLLQSDNRPEDAEENYALACGLYQQINEGKADKDCLACLTAFAGLLQQNGKYDEAIAQLKSAAEQALTLYGETDARFLEIWEKIAVLHYNNEHYISCRNQAKNTLKIRQKVDDGDSPKQYTLYFLLGKSYLFLNEPKIAKEYAEKALDICEKNKDMRKAWAADFYQILADAFWQLDEFQQAIDLIIKKKKPIVANLYGSSSPNVAEVYHSLGLYYSDWDRYENAEDYFNKAIRLYKALNEKGEHLSIVYRNLAVCFNRQGLYEEALEADAKSFLANCPLCEAFAYTDFFNSLSLLVESKQFIDPLATLFVLQDQLQLFYYKYQEEKEVGDLEKAHKVVKSAVWLTERLAKERGETADKTLIYQSARQTYLWGIAILHELYKAKQEKGYITEAFNLAEQDKSMRLEAMFHNSSNQHFGAIPDSLLQFEVECQKQLVAAEKQYTKTLLQQDDIKKTILYNDFVRLRRERDNAAKAIVKQYPDYKFIRTNFNQIDIAQVQKKLLDKNTVLIEYFVWEDIVYIFSLTEKDITCYETDLAGISLQTYMAESAQALGDPLLMKRAPKTAWENFINNSFELYEILLKPVMDNLPTGITQLIIVPDGLLYNIPFEVLLSEDAPIDTVNYKNLSYLIKSYSISYQYSAAQALQLHQIEKNTAAITLNIFETDYSMDVEMERAKEIMHKRLSLGTLSLETAASVNLKNMFPSSLFSGAAASEQNFKKSVKTADILHLSLFGQPDQTTLMKTGFVFTENGDTLEDNMLYVHEISALRLNAQLVVLAACEAAFGDFSEGQGLRSLIMGFHYAKVPSVLVSRWLTRDESSAAIMQSFYQYLAKGLPKDKALQQAKLDYIEKVPDAKAHPFYWAQYSLFGERRALQTQKPTTKSDYNWFKWLGGGAMVLILLVGLGWWLWWRGRQR